MPLDAAVLVYAETFHIEPHMADPPLKWWFMWQEWKQAEANHAAHQHKTRSKNWAKELSPQEVKSLIWSESDDGD